MALIQHSFKEPIARAFVQLLRSRDRRMQGRLRVGPLHNRSHRVLQRGGGFNRNLYTPEYVRRAIAYTEGNPVRRRFVQSPGERCWSSARVRGGYGAAPAPIDPCEGLV